MSKQNGMMKQLTKLGLILMMGVSMSACSSSVTWKEEVLLHDGSKIIVNRSQGYGGRHEIGQGGSIKEQEIIFTMPNTNKSLTFKSEFGEDIGGINFILLALHISNGTPYMVVEPRGCLASNKWGRPPHYVFFRHDGQAWQRIPLSAFPPEFKSINLVVNTKGEEKIITAQSVVSAELVGRLNGNYQTIQRDAVRYEGPGSCGEMIYGGKDNGGSGGWHGAGLFGDTYETCLQYCKRHKISERYSPCETLFKGKK